MVIGHIVSKSIGPRSVIHRITSLTYSPVGAGSVAPRMKQMDSAIPAITQHTTTTATIDHSTRRREGLVNWNLTAPPPL
jgi:hypothetical protein